MKIKATQLRKGMIIEFNNELYRLTEVFHNTPGKGQASVQTKMKSIKNGNNAENRFRSDETAIKASLESKEMEFLYQDGNDFYFMDTTSFEQMPIGRDVLGDSVFYLLPNVKVNINAIITNAVFFIYHRLLLCSGDLIKCNLRNYIQKATI